MRKLLVASLVLIIVGLSSPAAGQGSCGKAVVVTLPGVTWADIERVEPPNILAVAEEGAVGSMAVRTVSSRTSYASGFATIGAGTRIEAGRTTGVIVRATDTRAGLFQREVAVGGLAEMEELAEEAGYNAQPGALATAMFDQLDEVTTWAIGNSDPGLDPPVPLGAGRWAPLATMNSEGVARYAASSGVMLESADGYPFGVRTSPETAATAISSALSVDGCSLMVVDPGDLTRADELATTQATELREERDRALLAADGLVGVAASSLAAGDLLIVVSPTSPGWDEETHLGVAIARGPGFEAGSMLTSGSTRAHHLVTLPDVAPTVLAFFGAEQPAVMLGRPFVEDDSVPGDRIGAMVSLDEESVYSHGIQPDISTGYVLLQLVVLAVIALLLRRERREEGLFTAHPVLLRTLEWAALAVVSFPVAAYFSSPLPAHDLRLFFLVPLMIAIDLAVVAAVSVLIREPLDRLMAVALLTVAVMVVDLVFGGRLQFNAVFGNDPINAGRFAGLGNIAFAVLAACTIVAAALMVHRWPRERFVKPAVVGLFLIAVIADGAPQLGSDVGGVLALVPALAITYMLLSGRRPSWRVLLLGALGAVVALAVFLAIDLSRPLDARTHLGTFFTDVRDRGADVFFDTVGRKARTNFRVFRSTIWTYLVPPALGVIAYLLFRPRGSWQRLAAEYPRLRAGLIGGLVVAILGFLVNDSGIVVPAMILSILVPFALLTHLQMERAE